MQVDESVRIADEDTPNVAESNRGSLESSEKLSLLQGKYKLQSSGSVAGHEHSDFPVLHNRQTGIYRCLSYSAWIGAIIVCLILAAYLVDNFIRHAVPTIPAQHGNRPPEYILDRNWNFDETPKERTYHWVIEDKELNPDGVYRQMMVINGAFPGPMIECNEVDTLTVHVHNKALNATSIHWHGLFQNGTNWMDGTVGVTNCPIAPGHRFSYKFTVQGQSGTYHYHAHQGMQASDGIFGPLIIHSRNEKTLQKLPYSTDRVLMLQDHYHDLTGALLMKYLRNDRENVEPVPDGALINGRNIRNCDNLAHRNCDNTTSSHSILQLAPRENHRIRFINTGALAEFQVQIDEHEFAVTEVDGTDILPAYYHRLNISPAQRYSIVLSSATHNSKDAFWLRARMVTLCFKEENSHLDPEIRAIIQYAPENALIKNPPATLPKSRDWPDVVETECRDMNASELVPAEQISAPSKADFFFYIRSNFEIGDWRLSRGFFNTSSWRPDVHSPTLHRVSEGLANRNSSFILPSENNTATLNDKAFDIKREFVIQTTGVQVLDFVIQNFDDGNHPMHLHGHKYFVLAHGRGGFNADTVYPSLNLTNPLRRDTATLEGYEWLLIRLVADNPGAWALHCHISWHVEAGLLMQLVTRTDIIETWEIPAANLELCNAPHLERGTSPKDEIFFGNTP